MNKNTILNNLKTLDDLNIQLREQDTVLYWEIDKSTSNIINILNKEYSPVFTKNIINNNLDNIQEVVSEIELFNTKLSTKMTLIVDKIRQEVRKQ